MKIHLISSIILAITFEVFAQNPYYGAGYHHRPKPPLQWPRPVFGGYGGYGGYGPSYGGYYNRPHRPLFGININKPGFGFNFGIGKKKRSVEDINERLIQEPEEKLALQKSGKGLIPEDKTNMEKIVKDQIPVPKHRDARNFEQYRNEQETENMEHDYPDYGERGFAFDYDSNKEYTDLQRSAEADPIYGNLAVNRFMGMRYYPGMRTYSGMNSYPGMNYYPGMRYYSGMMPFYTPQALPQMPLGMPMSEPVIAKTVYKKKLDDFGNVYFVKIEEPKTQVTPMKIEKPKDQKVDAQKIEETENIEDKTDMNELAKDQIPEFYHARNLEQSAGNDYPDYGQETFNPTPNDYQPFNQDYPDLQRSVAPTYGNFATSNFMGMRYYPGMRQHFGMMPFYNPQYPPQMPIRTPMSKPVVANKPLYLKKVDDFGNVYFAKIEASKTEEVTPEKIEEPKEQKVTPEKIEETPE